MNSLKECAEWIRPAEIPDATVLPGTEPLCAAYFDWTADFTVHDAQVDHAPVQLRICSTGSYRAFVNGHTVGRGPVHGSNELRFYQIHEIPRSVLNTGTNYLAIQYFHEGKNSTTVQGFAYGEPGLIADIRQTDTQLCRSDTHWRVRQSNTFSHIVPQLCKWGGFRELFHGNPDTENPWEHAVCGKSETYAKELLQLPLPPLQHERLTPTRVVDPVGRGARITRSASSTTGMPFTIVPEDYGAMPELLFDFGCETVGYPSLTVSGSDSIWELWYGESQDVYRTDIVKFTNETRSWTAFHRRAFRYVKLALIYQEGPVVVEHLVQNQERYPLGACRIEPTDASHDTLPVDDLISVSDYTLKLSCSHIFEGCPLREPDIWVFDARIMARLCYRMYEDSLLARTTLVQMIALQRPNGMIPCVGPMDNTMFLPDFMMHLTLMADEYLRETGDTAFIASILPALRKAHEYLSASVDSPGLFVTTENAPPYIDWGPSVHRIGTTLFMSCLYLQHLRAMVSMLTTSGIDCHQLQQEAITLPGTIRRVFLDTDTILYNDLPTERSEANPSFLGNMMALATGIPDQESGTLLVDEIMNRAYQHTDGAFRLPFGPSSFLYVFDALNRYEANDHAPELIRRYWKPMLDRHCRTWWEVFDPHTAEQIYPHPYLGNTPTPEMDWIPVSHVHAWSSVVVLGLLNCGVAVEQA